MAKEQARPFTGEVEIDESYFGPRRGRGAGGKTPVIGLLKRGGKVFTGVVKNCSRAEPIIRWHIISNTSLSTMTERTARTGMLFTSRSETRAELSRVRGRCCKASILLACTNGSSKNRAQKRAIPMSFTVTKVDIWSSKIEDKPGSLAKVLGALGNAGANLDCVIARRDSAKSGSGIVFLTPVKGAATRKAAQSGGLAPAKNVATLKVEGDDAAGLGGRISTALADAGINLRGVSAAVIGKKFVAYFGFDSAADATKAARALKTLASPKKAGKGKR